MKALRILCVAALCGCSLAQAQNVVTTSIAPPHVENTMENPIVWSANDVYVRQSKFIVAAAEAMPAEKYSYKPTNGQWTFGKIISHIAMANSHVCGMLNDTKAPASLLVAPTASKEELLAALKGSFTFCDTAMKGLQDEDLTVTITFFGGKRVPRSRALFEEVGDLEDHYSQLAMYMRLNDLIPPSAEIKSSAHR